MSLRQAHVRLMNLYILAHMAGCIVLFWLSMLTFVVIRFICSLPQGNLKLQSSLGVKRLACVCACVCVYVCTSSCRHAPDRESLLLFTNTAPCGLVAAADSHTAGTVL